MGWGIWAILIIPREIIDTIQLKDKQQSTSSHQSKKILKTLQDFFKALKEDFNFLWKSPVLISILAIDFISNLWAAATVLLLVYAQEVLNLGSSGYGLLAGSIAASGMIT